LFLGADEAAKPEFDDGPHRAVRKKGEPARSPEKSNLMKSNYLSIS